ncbi:MAG: PilZ domain-containing protein [Candidatus Omnitrophica bacterium]|nr:PilZ domain-containing protein [Candidatus Omnitrophota bacterium]
MSTERRRAPRIAEQVSLAIQDAESSLQTDTKNLSASGVYCTLSRFLAPMTKVELQFELPGALRRRRVRCSGVIVRVEPVIAHADQGLYHVAIFFTELSERDRAAIARFVQRRLTAGVPTS